MSLAAANIILKCWSIPDIVGVTLFLEHNHETGPMMLEDDLWLMEMERNPYNELVLITILIHLFINLFFYLFIYLFYLFIYLFIFIFFWGGGESSKNLWDLSKVMMTSGA